MFCDCIYLRFPAAKIIKYEQQTKKTKQMVVYNNVTIHNINKIECPNVQTFKSKCKFLKLQILLEG